MVTVAPLVTVLVRSTSTPAAVRSVTMSVPLTLSSIVWIVSATPSPS